MKALPPLPAGWRAEFHDAIGAIAAADWDACAGPDSPFVRHAHLQLLEQCGLATPEHGYRPRHVVLHDASGAVVATAPAYLKTHSNGERGLDLGFSLAHQRAAGPYYPKLQVEVPMTPVTGPRLLVRAGEEGVHTRAVLLGALRDEADRCEATSLQIVHMSAEDRAAAAAAGMLAGEGNVHVWRPGGTPSFEALLARMHSWRRGSIRHERRIVASSGLTIRRLSGAQLDAAWSERFFALYTSTYERHASVPWLNADYFRRLFRDLGDVVELLAAFDGETCVAAVLCVRSPATLHVLHWGQTGERPFLHFELVFYRTIERAIELGVEALDCGSGGRHKAPRGIALEAVHHAAWFRAPAFVETATLALAQRRAAAAAERAAENARLPFAAAGDAPHPVTTAKTSGKPP